MQFLVIGRVLPTNLTASEQEVEMTIAGMKQFQEDNRTKSLFGFAGEDAGCLICDCNTAEELDEYLMLNPLSMFTEWEIHTLTSAEKTVATMEMLLKHIKQLKPAA